MFVAVVEAYFMLIKGNQHKSKCVRILLDLIQQLEIFSNKNLNTEQDWSFMKLNG